jgi:hypothetical protein
LNRERFISSTSGTLVASALLAAPVKGTTMTATSSIETAMEKGRAARQLTVYHVDAYTTTRTAIRPDQLEKFPGVEVHVTREQGSIGSALAALHASVPASTSETREYRWKLVFADASGVRLLEVYASSFQPYGRIDEMPVAFANDDLVTWLRTTFAPNER